MTGLFNAARSSSASWLAVPSKPMTLVRNRLSFAQATSSSVNRVSHSATAISALSTISVQLGVVVGGAIETDDLGEKSTLLRAGHQLVRQPGVAQRDRDLGLVDDLGPARRRGWRCHRNR